jgi:hypothetical protein
MAFAGVDYLCSAEYERFNPCLVLALPRGGPATLSRPAFTLMNLSDGARLSPEIRARQAEEERIDVSSNIVRARKSCNRTRILS